MVLVFSSKVNGVVWKVVWPVGLVVSLAAFTLLLGPSVILLTVAPPSDVDRSTSMKADACGMSKPVFLKVCIAASSWGDWPLILTEALGIRVASFMPFCCVHMLVVTSPAPVVVVVTMACVVVCTTAVVVVASCPIVVVVTGGTCVVVVFSLSPTVVVCGIVAVVVTTGT